MSGTARAVFLSYRREETRHIAGRLADRLADRLGSAQVFMDVDTLEPGADFAAAIAREVASCDVLIALIGPTWLTTTGLWRRRRIDDADDFVFLEIRAALERDIYVIPVLVDGAVMPKRHDLPEGLQGLAQRSAIRLDHETFNSDITILLNVVDRILPTFAEKAIEPTAGTDTGVGDRATNHSKEDPEQVYQDNNPEVLVAGHGKGAGAPYSPLAAHPHTPPPPTLWSRSRFRLLTITVIVITLAVAGGIVLLVTKRPPQMITATVAINGDPNGVAVSPDGRHVYITNRGFINFGSGSVIPTAGSVLVIDTSSNEITATIPVDGEPLSVAVSPDGNRAYITTSHHEPDSVIPTSGSVLVIDTVSNTVTATIPISDTPNGVAISPDGRRAYITNYYSGSVSVIDTGNNTVTATITVDFNPQGVAVSPDGRRAYIIPNPNFDSVAVMDTASNMVTATIPVEGPNYGIAVSPDGHRLYITCCTTNGGSGSVSVIDAGSNTVSAIIPVSGEPKAVAVSPDGHYAYITSSNYDIVDIDHKGLLSVIDTGSNTVTETISAGDQPFGVAFSPDGRSAYITDRGSSNSGSVVVIDTGVG